LNVIRIAALQYFELEAVSFSMSPEVWFAAWVICALFTNSVMCTIAIWPNLTPFPLFSVPRGLAGFVGVFVVEVFAIGIFT
jgi:hypothetical protein